MKSRYNVEEMRKAHKFTHSNLWYLCENQNCRCIYCLEEFESLTIYDYTLDDTALCPYCGIDAVIGEKSGYTINKEEAQLFYEFFFNNSKDSFSEHISDLDLLDKYRGLF